jgi:hypothetical protein
MKEGIGLGIVTIALVLLPLIGEVLCIYKAVKCNWEPVGKAEMVYTVSAITGLGCIVGYIDIQDK